MTAGLFIVQLLIGLGVVLNYYPRFPITLIGAALMATSVLWIV
jgi:hypothetical protein